MARKKTGNSKAVRKATPTPDRVENTAPVQADQNSIALGSFQIGGNVTGNITIGHGYTAEQVSLLLTQITSRTQPKPFDGRCPYKGLEVFEEEDADLFFGRERLVEDLLSRVRDSRTVFITGPSGSGKSSLVRAGLLHTLKQGEMKGSERWLYETMKPGREPIKELGLAFSRLKGPELADYFQAHANETDVLHRCAESVLSGRKDQRFVLFIDQFEEVFTQINGEEERLAFINMLAHAGTTENGRVIVLFAMRSDFVSNCATYPALNELLSQEFRQIGAMQPEELVAAIALPAQQVGLPIEDELIARIINDMKGEPGALPLMQFALKDLFDAQQEKGGVIALTLKDYLQHGGIHKSLERHADSTFARLGENEQELARSIFGSLIEIGRGTQDTRRTALFDELVPANASVSDVETIVRKLADARLVITDEQAGRDTVTISHEKLIDAWPWLKKLVNDNRDVIVLQNEIAGDAKEWEDHGRDPSYLYTGARLANAREQLEAKKLVLSGLAQEFIEAGVRAHTEELEAATQRANQLRRRSVYLSVALAVALLAVGVAVFFSIQSRKQTNIAVARQISLQAQPIFATRNSKEMVSVLLAIQSMKMFPNPEAAQVLENHLLATPIAHTTHTAPVSSVAFSPDGKYVLSGSYDGTARIWESGTGKEIVRMTLDYGLLAVAFSPDGKYVVSGGGDRTARVWESRTGKEINYITHDDVVQFVGFSPDGRFVMSGSQHEIKISETMTGREISRMTEDGIMLAIALSPDGKYIAAGGCKTDENGGCANGTAFVWEATTGKEISHLPLDGTVAAVAFDPDGKYLSLGSCNIDENGHCMEGVILIQEVATGKEITRISYGLGGVSVRSIAFSPDGKYLVSGGADSAAHVWEIATGKAIAQMTHDSVVVAVALSPDGKYVVSGSEDSTARVWEILTGKEIARMTHDHGFFNGVSAVAFSPDGKYVVSGGRDNTAYVWDPTDDTEVARGTPNIAVGAVAFSPDRKYVALGVCTRDETASCTKDTILVRELSTDRVITQVNYTDLVTSLAFSSSGKYLVSASQDNNGMSVWEVATGKQISYISQNTGILGVGFSPDEKYIVSGSYDHIARVWEVKAGKQVIELPHEDEIDVHVSSAAFSPDGNYIATGGSDSTVRIWEAKTGNEIAHMQHEAGVTTIAFSPDGRYLASGSLDNTARVWEVSTGKEISRVTHNGFLYSVAFSPDGKYAISNSLDKTARIWQVDSGQELVQIFNEYEHAFVFNLDGRNVLSVSSDGSVHARTWQAHDLIANACSRVTRNLTYLEWQQFIKDALPYQAVCPDLPIEPEPVPMLPTTPTAIP